MCVGLFATCALGGRVSQRGKRSDSSLSPVSTATPSQTARHCGESGEMPLAVSAPHREKPSAFARRKSVFLPLCAAICTLHSLGKTSVGRELGCSQYKASSGRVSLSHTHSRAQDRLRRRSTATAIAQPKAHTLESLSSDGEGILYVYLPANALVLPFADSLALTAKHRRVSESQERWAFLYADRCASSQRISTCYSVLLRVPVARSRGAKISPVRKRCIFEFRQKQSDVVS